ncbi:flagellar protein FlgN [Algisphaera agarilytica]|uniref:DNA polymerase III gamma/tau subunit n=1 Tax=Algisphaera agarilytica TaxID=1385975 RepID=A0A7X0H7I8_9BACT|nr:flagellar protein FlgN [Algisphaera agarilytica]MBB6430730.1 DNA polymerase III gamma/tau subunit [Algisphaera agarilytica]
MTPPPASLSDAVQSDGQADQLIEMLTQQRDLYKSLEALSGKQQEIIAQGQAEQLLGVLSERQVIVDRLTQINQDLSPLRGRMSEIAEASTEAKRQLLRSLVDEVQAMLESIIQRDEQDRQSLEASKAQVGQELAKVKTAPAAINAYKANAYGGGAAGASPTARFTDSSG